MWEATLPWPSRVVRAVCLVLAYRRWEEVTYVLSRLRRLKPLHHSPVSRLLLRRLEEAGGERHRRSVERAARCTVHFEQGGNVSCVKPWRLRDCFLPRHSPSCPEKCRNFGLKNWDIIYKQWNTQTLSVRFELFRQMPILTQPTPILRHRTLLSPKTALLCASAVKPQTPPCRKIPHFF